MTRRQFLQLSTWWTVAAALRVKVDATPAPVPQVTGWGVPWRVSWMIGAEKPERQFLPLINK